MEDISIFYNSHDLFFKNPFGAVPCGSKVILTVSGEKCEEVNLELIYFNGTKNVVLLKNHANYFKGEIWVGEPGLIEYYFSFKRENQWFYYGNNEQVLGGIGKIYSRNPKPYQITVYEDFKVPSWYKEGIMYQIFVDSFCNGTEKKLRNNGAVIEDKQLNNSFQNIKQEKFCICDNSSRNIPKQVLNSKKNSFIYGQWQDEPMYIKDSDGNILRWAFYGGNLQGVIEKLSYLKTLGVTIIYLNPIFEATSVHKYDTGDYLKIDAMFGDEKIFKELCEKAEDIGIKIILDGVFSHVGDDSIYFNKYGNYPSLGAYESKKSIYYNWFKFKKYPNDYECWWGVKSLPNVEELEPSYMDFIIKGEDSVISKWLRLGASGWRLDVADELPDAFIEALKKRVKEIKEEGIVLGEVWEDASNKVSYGERRKYLLGKELDSVMNYPFRNLTIDFLRGYLNSEDFAKRIMSLYENYPREVFYSNMNLLGTHDTERLLTLFLTYSPQENIAKALFKLATLLQMTFPGVPCIYYGDEAGLTGGKDPYNRKAYPWGKENKEILNWYRTITALRSIYVVFKKGEFKFHPTPKNVLCFERTYENQRAITVVNRSITETITVELSLKEKEGLFQNLFKEEEEIEVTQGVLKINLAPLDGIILMGKLGSTKRA